MSNKDDPQLRGFMKGLIRAEAAEAAAGEDVPDRTADERFAAAMVDKYAPARRSPRRRLAVAVSLSAAAAVGLVFLSRLLFLPARPLLAYELELRTDEKVMGAQAPGDQVKQLRPDGSLEIYLRPRSALSGNINVKSFVRNAQGCRSWPVALEHLPNGGLRLRSPTALLPALPTGSVDLLFSVSQGSLPPSDFQICSLKERAQRCGPDCQILLRSIEVLGP
jgi:hypothetical protein